MRIAVVGYGKMGHEVESVLRERGHEPVIVRHGEPLPPGCDAGIDFTHATDVLANVRAALSAHMKYVVGTTGWSQQHEDVRILVTEAGGGLVHAANFSLGVNLFYRVVRQAATLMARFDQYDPYVSERHHRMKKDAPSGTAKVLAGIVETASGKKSISELDGAPPEGTFHVSALRAGGIVGEHTVGFDSGTDEILLEHRARTRRGFAAGSVLAAEWIATRTGFHDFSAVLDDIAGT